MKKLSALLLAGVMASTLLATSVRAEDEETLSSSAASTTEDGPFTSSHPLAAHIVTAPLRLATTSAFGAIGLVGGTFKGIGTGVQDTFGYTENFGPSGDDTLSRAERGLLYFPTATVSSIYYVPRNVALEGGKTAWDLGNKGYEWWNRF